MDSIMEEEKSVKFQDPVLDLSMKKSLKRTPSRGISRQQSYGGSSLKITEQKYKKKNENFISTTPKLDKASSEVPIAEDPKDPKMALNKKLYDEETEIAENVYKKLIETKYMEDLKKAFRDYMEEQKDGYCLSAEDVWRATEAKSTAPSIPENVRLGLIKKVQHIDTHSQIENYDPDFL
mmetsp:Transcript_3214/g.4533  ORF Transcript_3214/g.4533 Transcript_3214/m.4533 type:complete len:179 (-) Transcript_3214:35-571(-)